MTVITTDRFKGKSIGNPRLNKPCTTVDARQRSRSQEMSHRRVNHYMVAIHLFFLSKYGTNIYFMKDNPLTNKNMPIYKLC